MHELIANIHIHTNYSDGASLHKEVAQAALKSDVDILIITDHNVLIKNLEGYHETSKKKVLILVGEEIHDMTSMPVNNHLLVMNTGIELATFASNPQLLIDQVRSNGGLSFIAHPYEQDMVIGNEAPIPWINWQVHGYTGIEIWNGLSEIRRARNMLHAILLAYFPALMAINPPVASLRKWDELISKNKKIVAIAGSDAHALNMKQGIFQRTVFPYEFHFRSINTHLYTPYDLCGDLDNDRKMVYTALNQGNAFIGYDLPAQTKGFRFSAHGRYQQVITGENIEAHDGITFQINTPEPCECHLIRDGEVIKIWEDNQIHTFITNQTGAYRVECFITYLGKKRGWIYSNPIYLY